MIPFQLHTPQMYQGKRLKQLVHSIEKVGLMNPIIVHLTSDGKDEIICGHNWASTTREFGRNVSLADVWEGLSDWNSRRSTTRDRMSCRLGIAATTLSKYKSITDDLVDVLARLLDEEKITFEAAYRMSGLTPRDVRILMTYIEESPNKKIDLGKLKELGARRKRVEDSFVPVRSESALKEVVVSKPIVLQTIHRN